MEANILNKCDFQRNSAHKYTLSMVYTDLDINESIFLDNIAVEFTANILISLGTLNVAKSHFENTFEKS